MKLIRNVLALNVAERTQSFAKPVQEWIGLGFGGNPEDAIELCVALRTRRSGQHQHSTEKRDEISPLHDAVRLLAHSTSAVANLRTPDRALLAIRRQIESRTIA